mmetsp:Transcript_117653/g.374867  ORF Transcript_117653/g.374867 Transcript_117653/m.374867 type:complete len:229 (-) Transcript_117653:644-1330(-)
MLFCPTYCTTSWIANIRSSLPKSSRPPRRQRKWRRLRMRRDGESTSARRPIWRSSGEPTRSRGRRRGCSGRRSRSARRRKPWNDTGLTKRCFERTRSSISRCRSAERSRSRREPRCKSSTRKTGSVPRACCNRCTSRLRLSPTGGGRPHSGTTSSERRRLRAASPSLASTTSSPFSRQRRCSLSTDFWFWSRGARRWRSVWPRRSGVAPRSRRRLSSTAPKVKVRATS